MSDSTPEAEVAGPLLRVVRGTPTEDELAALVTVIASRRGNGDNDEAAARLTTVSAWAARERGIRHPPAHAPDAWRRSALPR